MEGSTAQPEQQQPQEEQQLTEEQLAYQQRFDKAVDNLFALEKAEDWQFLKENRGVKISKKVVPGSPASLMRGEKLMDCSVEELKAILRAVERRKEWDPLTASCKKVKQVTDLSAIAYIQFVTSWPVSVRDLCYYASFRTLEDGTLVFAAFSVEDKACPPVSSNVRADLLASGFIIRPLQDQEGKCHVTYLIQVDLKGWLPGWITNLVGEEAPLVLDRIQLTIDRDRAGIQVSQ
ncbi:hypothetical protein QOT17_006798 [Balamuthia mandrillaris]